MKSDKLAKLKGFFVTVNMVLEHFKEWNDNT